MVTSLSTVGFQAPSLLTFRRASHGELRNRVEKCMRRPSKVRTSPNPTPIRMKNKEINKNLVDEKVITENLERDKVIVGKEDIEMMKDSEEYSDGRYGTCGTCNEGRIMIPGLAHYLCENCGWVDRQQNNEIIAPTSHHE